MRKEVLELLRCAISGEEKNPNGYGKVKRGKTDKYNVGIKMMDSIYGIKYGQCSNNGTGLTTTTGVK